MPLSRCDLAGERLLDRSCDAQHISYPSESLIVMIWHMDVGFPTQGYFTRSGTLRSGLDPDMPTPTNPLLMAERAS
jgi:hypothetical protein